MSDPDRLSPEMRTATLLELRLAAQMLAVSADVAAAAGRGEERAVLVARLAILRGRLSAGEGGARIADTAEVFVEDYVAFLEVMRPMVRYGAPEIRRRARALPMTRMARDLVDASRRLRDVAARSRARCERCIEQSSLQVERARRTLAEVRAAAAEGMTLEVRDSAPTR